MAISADFVRSVAVIAEGVPVRHGAEVVGLEERAHERWSPVQEP